MRAAGRERCGLDVVRTDGRRVAAQSDNRRRLLPRSCRLSPTLRSAGCRLRVARELDIERRRSTLWTTVSGNGTKLPLNAARSWAGETGIYSRLIAPGKPQQNGYYECFNVHLSNELLKPLFRPPGHARAVLEHLRRDHHEQRPDPKLG